MKNEGMAEQCKRTRRLLAVTCLVKDLSLTIACGGRIAMSGIDSFNAEQRRAAVQTQSNVVRPNDLFKGEEEQKIKVAIVGGGPGGLFTAWHLEAKAGTECDITIF